MSRRFKKSGSQKVKRSVNIVLLTIYLLLVCFLLFLIFKYNILAFRYLNLVVTALVLLVALVGLLLIIYKKAEKFTIFCWCSLSLSALCRSLQYSSLLD